MRNRTIWSAPILCAASLLAAILAGCLLLTCAYALPTGRMLTNVDESYASIEAEGGSFSWAPGYPGARLDEYTDNIMMQNAVFAGTGSPLKDAMLNPRMDFPKAKLSPGDALINYVYGARNGEVVTYSRYWHGYLLFLKPLLLFFNLSDIRMMNMLLQWSLAAALLMLANRRAGLRLVIPTAAALWALNPVSTALSFQYSSIYLLTLLGCIAQLSFRLYQKKNGWLLYLWLGILTAFFDFLTYPPVAPCMCLILGLVLTDGSPRDKLTHAVAVGTAWGVGYGGMWGGKWLAGSLLTGQNLLSEAMENVKSRAGSYVSATEGGVEATYGQVLTRNLGVYANVASLLLLLALTALTAYLMLRRGYRLRMDLGLLVSLGATALIPFLWYFVLKNHSCVHYWMTHRNLSVTIMAMISLVSFSLYNTGGAKHG